MQSTLKTQVHTLFMLFRCLLNHRSEFRVYKLCIFLALSAEISPSRILALIFLMPFVFASCIESVKHVCQLLRSPSLSLSLCLSSFVALLLWTAPISIKSWSHWTVAETRDSPQANCGKKPKRKNRKFNRQQSHFNFFFFFLPHFFFGSVFFCIWISYWPISAGQSFPF